MNSMKTYVITACAFLLGTITFGRAYADVAKPGASGQLEGLSYVETITSGVEQRSELPMVIALHYMTGSAATSIEDYGGIDAPVRLLALEGPHALDGGFSWFPDGYYELDATSQLEETISVSNRVARFVRAAIEVYPTRGKPILTGYSQGG